jgi:hypothetical protein
MGHICEVGKQLLILLQRRRMRVKEEGVVPRETRSIKEKRFPGMQYCDLHLRSDTTSSTNKSIIACIEIMDKRFARDQRLKESQHTFRMNRKE